MPLPMLTQAELVDEIAEETGFAKGQVRHVLAELEISILRHIGECHRVRVGKLIQIEPKVKKKTKERQGRNPATGEEITIAAQPAGTRVAVRALKTLNEAAPTLPRLRKRISQS